MELAGLGVYREVGMADPAVEAAFARAGISPAEVVAKYPTYLPAQVTGGRGSHRSHGTQPGRRASPKRAPWALLDRLAGCAVAGLALFEALPLLAPQDAVD